MKLTVTFYPCWRINEKSGETCEVLSIAPPWATRIFTVRVCFDRKNNVYYSSHVLPEAPYGFNKIIKKHHFKNQVISKPYVDDIVRVLTYVFPILIIGPMPVVPTIIYEDA